VILLAALNSPKLGFTSSLKIALDSYPTTGRLSKCRFDVEKSTMPILNPGMCRDSQHRELLMKGNADLLVKIACFVKKKFGIF